MKYALISVSNKDLIIPFAQGLIELGFNILSTGGSKKILQENGIPCLEVASLTNTKELFDGRVKTLHPLVFGGILYKRDDPSHLQDVKEYDIKDIQVVCVNLYPFKQTTKSTDNFDEIIENIDIGGPSLIRASAKNYKSVMCITSSDDYLNALEILKSKDEVKSLEFKEYLMIKAFEHTASYDSYIANYMNERFKNGFGDRYFIEGKKVFNTKYGENPHQLGALYEFDKSYSDSLLVLKGEPSFNNLTDINQALNIISSFESSCIVIIKHGNPCGFGLDESLSVAYKNAMKCDSISAYGGVIAIKGVLDASLANELKEHFFEVIIALKVEEEALELFSSKKRVKIFEAKNSLLAKDKYDFRHINGGFMLQESDFVKALEVQDSTCKTIKATKNQLKDLEIAYKISACTKSNCISFVKEGTLIAIGMGMTSRVDAIKAAKSKAYEVGLSLEGSAMASEAFFPFKDSIELASTLGVTSIIQPGGSIRDSEVIACANEKGIALYFSHIRHFLH